MMHRYSPDMHPAPRGIRSLVHPFDPAQHTGQFHVAPVPGHAEFRGEVRQGEFRRYIFKLDPVTVNALVCCRPGPFKGDGKPVLTLQGNIAQEDAFTQ